MLKQWNNTVAPEKVSKRRDKMLRDAKKLSRLDHNQNINRVGSTSHPISEFDSICSTFGFEHHEGTSYDLELKIIKIILKRECLLMTLRHMCDFLNERMHDNKTLPQVEGEKIIQTLRQMRDLTVDFLELVQIWRQSSEKYDYNFLQPFFWEKENYILKVIIDLDFLADTPSMVAALNIPRDKYILNPLMLPNTLNEGEPTSDAKNRAIFDAGGEIGGILYEERLRIRKAEEFLNQEVEFHRKSSLYESIVLDDRLEAVTPSSLVVVPPSSDMSMIYEARPPTREGDSRNSNKSGQIQSRQQSGSVRPRIQLDYRKPEDSSMLDTPSVSGGGVLGNITSSDVENLSRVTDPDQCLQLAASAIIILLSEQNEIPADLSWKAFVELCRGADVAWELNSLDPSSIHEAKSKILSPILMKLFEARDKGDKTSSETDAVLLVKKITKWVIQTTNLIYASINEPKKAASSPVKPRSRGDVTKRGTSKGASSSRISGVLARNQDLAVRVYSSPQQKGGGVGGMGDGAQRGTDAPLRTSNTSAVVGERNVRRNTSI